MMGTYMPTQQQKLSPKLNLEDLNNEQCNILHKTKHYYYHSSDIGINERFPHLIHNCARLRFSQLENTLDYR